MPSSDAVRSAGGSGPLAGIVVAGSSRAPSGPGATMLLADLGAEVDGAGDAPTDAAARSGGGPRLAPRASV